MVERDVGPGVIEFHRYSSADEAYADAASDRPARKWELADASDRRARWTL
jgi:hypothetical protein